MGGDARRAHLTPAWTAPAGPPSVGRWLSAPAKRSLWTCSASWSGGASL